MLENYTNKIIIIIFFSLLIPFSVTSQELFKNKNIDTVFSNYTERPRELAYVHLNKSTYIKNEDIGLTGYVFSKNDKKLSLITKNLYCVIKDKNNKTIKEKLLKVDKGFTSTIFKVDSVFSTGEYKFFAYTNWMKNFKEQNFFVQSFKVINPVDTKIIKNNSISDKIDAQFLPESGHIIANIRNTIGVIIKNELGAGIPNISGNLLNDKNEVTASFKVNKLGIGRFSFVPENDKKYRVKINYNDKESIFNINEIERKGIIISVIQKTNEVLISVKTNQLTLSSIENKNYTITLHNGENITSFPVKFKNKTVNKVFKIENLTPGINVFTLFDQFNNPIAERMVFNYEGIKTIKSDALKVEKTSDSLDISISYKNINPGELNNFSISVLPQNTISYNNHHSIISQTYLQPYIKGSIEKAHYYFKDINNTKKYHLDNLLLTQGWSSYSWNTIFNHSSNLNYFFENGITFKANVNNTKKSKYAVHSVNNKKPNYFVLDKNEKEFIAPDLYPLKDEKLKISKIKNKGKIVASKLDPQFFPNSIPELNLEYALFENHKNPQIETIIDAKESTLITNSLNKVQQVDEVIIKANLEKRRIEKIKNRSLGKIYTVDEHYRKISMKVYDFINGKGGYIGGIDPGNNNVWIGLRNSNSSIHGGGSPTIYLDGQQLIDFQVLFDIDTSIIDYIDINRNGLGEGVRAGGGVIKIFTNPMLAYTEKNVKKTQEFPFPITFSDSKKYFSPQYQNYNSSFYKEYGVLDWLPINKINENGTLSFKVENIQYNNLKLFIEGYSNDGTFISETREIVLD